MLMMMMMMMLIMMTRKSRTLENHVLVSAAVYSAAEGECDRLPEDV